MANANKNRVCLFCGLVGDARDLKRHHKKESHSNEIVGGWEVLVCDGEVLAVKIVRAEWDEKSEEQKASERQAWIAALTAESRTIRNCGRQRTHTTVSPPTSPHSLAQESATSSSSTDKASTAEPQAQVGQVMRAETASVIGTNDGSVPPTIDAHASTQLSSQGPNGQFGQQSQFPPPTLELHQSARSVFEPPVALSPAPSALGQSNDLLLDSLLSLPLASSNDGVPFVSPEPATPPSSTVAPAFLLESAMANGTASPFTPGGESIGACRAQERSAPHVELPFHHTNTSPPRNNDGNEIVTTSTTTTSTTTTTTTATATSTTTTTTTTNATPSRNDVDDERITLFAVSNHSSFFYRNAHLSYEKTYRDSLLRISSTSARRSPDLMCESNALAMLHMHPDHAPSKQIHQPPEITKRKLEVRYGVVYLAEWVALPADGHGEQQQPPPPELLARYQTLQLVDWTESYFVPATTRFLVVDCDTLTSKTQSIVADAMAKTYTEFLCEYNTQFTLSLETKLELTSAGVPDNADGRAAKRACHSYTVERRFTLLEQVMLTHKRSPLHAQYCEWLRRRLSAMYVRGRSINVRLDRRVPTPLNPLTHTLLELSAGEQQWKASSRLWHVCHTFAGALTSLVYRQSHANAPCVLFLGAPCARDSPLLRHKARVSDELLDYARALATALANVRFDAAARSIKWDTRETKFSQSKPLRTSVRHYDCSVDDVKAIAFDGEGEPGDVDVVLLSGVLRLSRADQVAQTLGPLAELTLSSSASASEGELIELCMRLGDQRMAARQRESSTQSSRGHVRVVVCCDHVGVDATVSDNAADEAFTSLYAATAEVDGDDGAHHVAFSRLSQSMCSSATHSLRSLAGSPHVRNEIASRGYAALCTAVAHVEPVLSEVQASVLFPVVPAQQERLCSLLERARIASSSNEPWCAALERSINKFAQRDGADDGVDEGK